MEELTKQQIVLVTLLVSFVTSIATGIVTVALMDQAPPGVTQTINRVVERTIEKVTPPTSNQAAAVVTKETVVVKEDDLVVKAVEQNTASMVSIFGVLGSGDSVKTVFLGNGLIVSKDGTIAGDVSVLEPILDDSQNLIQETFKAVLSDGSEVVIVSAPDVLSVAAGSLALFKPKADDKTKLPMFTPASLASADSLKLGQTVIALGGEKISVATGIVSNLSQNSSSADVTASTSPKMRTQIIKTDISSPSKAPGGILVNLSGDVVGIRLASAGAAENLFLTANIIPTAVSKSVGAATSTQ